MEAQKQPKFYLFELKKGYFSVRFLVMKYT